jgi:hypothetical protein
MIYMNIFYSAGIQVKSICTTWRRIILLKKLDSFTWNYISSLQFMLQNENL